MKTRPIVRGLALAAAVAVVLSACSGTPDATETAAPTAEPTLEEIDGGENSYSTRQMTDGTTSFVLVENPGDGPVLTYGAESGFDLLEETEGDLTYAFKDMNGNGSLDTWEDWRESARDRAADLASEISIEQAAGLMLFSAHEYAPSDGLTEAQQEYLAESRLRNILNGGPNDVEPQVTWVNAMQSYVESLAAEGEPYIPVNYSSDPRSTASAAYYDASGDISRWPSNLGLAATFDPETMRAHAEMASAEYRALGITTALGPQMDLATEPRWNRVDGTFGEDLDLASQMAQAYVAGFQGTRGVDGWGPESVNTMIKHWPGDAVGEGGRESHWDSGKFAVYPGNNFDTHVELFNSVLDSAAVMTSYSIAVDGDGEPLFSELVGTAYDAERMSVLRDDNAYQGVVVTDWGVTRAPDPTTVATAWGAGDLTDEERHYRILQTGIDMFGGNNDVAPVLAAYDLWQADFEAGVNDVDAETRFRETGARVLNMLFQPGLFENPFLDLEASSAVVASQDKVDAGYAAQLQSVVMLKNDGQISASQQEEWADKTVYIPRAFDTGFLNFRGDRNYTEGAGLTLEVAERYFGTVVTDEAVLDENEQVVSYTAPDLTDVDLVLVGMGSPNNGSVAIKVGFDEENDEYFPLSLQYGEYTADGPNVRQTSISGDILEDGTRENRSYFGNSSRISNGSHLDALTRALDAVAASGRDIPVITILKANNPTIPAEFEGLSDAIVVGFGTSDQALIEVALGLHEPEGRLPMAFPANMDTVEAQLEDVGEDVEPYVDSAGNTYSVGFGLNYAGPIAD